MKRIILSALIFSIINFGFSQFVSQEEAFNVAKNCYLERLENFSGEKSFNLHDNAIEFYDINNEVVIYVFERLDKEGFIMISAEKSVFPILGYSFESGFDIHNLPPPVKSMIEHRTNEITMVRKNKELARSNDTKEWNKYKSDNFKINKDIKSVAPLLETKWNQGCYYNEMCPEDPVGPCGYVYAGCVVTAMGQVMKYHNYPETGESSGGYTHPVYGTMHVYFSNATYYWDLMENQLTESNLYVAELLYHLGVSVDMNYSPTGSGANSQDAALALKNYFKYSYYLELLSKSSFSDDGWGDMLKVELHSKRPVYYRGYSSDGGHAFVCDGYQGNNHFHINWGWGGSADGYFYLHNLGGFTSDQSAIFGVEPREGDIQYCTNYTLMTQQSGIISDGSGDNRYGNNSSCKWLIQVEDAEAIVLTFTKLNTEPYIDLIGIYEGTDEYGTMVDLIYGFELPEEPIVVAGNSMFIWFYSDEMNRASGWEAEYTSWMINIDSYDKGEISLSPNPVNDILTITFDNKRITEFNCKIQSVTGQVVFEKHCNTPPSKKSLNIDVSHLSKGIYNISIENKDFGVILNEKIVIQ